MASKNDILESVREEDFVEYYIFPKVDTQDEVEQANELSRVLNEANKIIQKYTQNYLWHKDEFKLVARTSIINKLIESNSVTGPLPPHLYGISHFGDNLEDEWFMVFLLQQLTTEIQGSIAKVHDVDGEFILIEAADHLPEWANPETCDNRVYIYQGQIHLVPLDDQPAEMDPEDDIEPLPINQALEVIRNNPSSTLASTDVQNSIKHKLRSFPEKISENFHHSTAYLPVGVAAILNHKPNLIAPAVQAFCNRDPVDLKACRAMKYFPPENRVNTRVKFTKLMYAMLTHSKYVPDRRTGWDLPPRNSPQFKSHDLGVKIASGFEILASQAKPTKNTDDQDSIDQDKGWVKFLQSLTQKDYFKGLLEHSRDYNYLLNKAKEYYISHRDSMQYSSAIGQEILDLTKTLDYKVEDLKVIESNLPEDDSDAWLDVTPEELDKMLQEKYGSKKFTTVNSSLDPSNFTENISKFLNHTSGYKGVEFPMQDGDDSSPQRPPRGVKTRNKVSFSQDAKKSTATAEDKSQNRVSFDPDQFSCAIQKMLDFAIPEDDSWDLESGSDMSDYAEDNYVNQESIDDFKTKMQQYMAEMDKELSSTTIGESFEKQTNGGDAFEDIENFQPVDIDTNALKNILESYRSQLGEAGPSSNMLGPMGLHLDTTSQGK